VRASAEQVELWSSAAANLATIFALVIGGWWAYTRFIRQRTEQPRATLTYRAAHRRFTDREFLLRVSVRATNSGTVLLGVRELRCEIQQVIPPMPEALAKLKARELINEHDEADLDCIRCYEQEWTAGEVEIEPNESESFDFDFIVDSEVETILIYADLPNAERKDGGGWQAAGFYDFDATKAPQVDQQSDGEEGV
jgi:flagellar biogenesis protein FliO